MREHLIQKILAMGIFAKAVAYKKGALLMASAPLSVGIYEVLFKLTEHVSFNNLVMPLITMVVCISLYFAFFMLDLITGLAASKKLSNEDPDWIKSHRLYGSLGKIGSVLLIDTTLLIILLFLAIFEMESSYSVFMFLSLSINVLFFLYELHSIGENLKKITGKKPSLFAILDKITSIIEKRITSKIAKTIDPKGDDYPNGEGKTN